MDIIQKTESFDFTFDRKSNLERLKTLFKNKPVIRFSVTDFNNKQISCDYSEITEQHKSQKDIFEFNPRKFVNNNSFNAVMVIPTGIGAEVGGDSGDACVNARLIGSVVDNLITHPNVVNAADFNEMTPNTLYVEGSILNRFMLGTVGLSKSLGNKVLMIYDETTPDGQEIPEYIKNCSINAASALRVTIGNNIDVIGLKNPPQYNMYYNEQGMAVGEVLGIDKLINVIDKYKDEYDSFALHTVLHSNDMLEISQKYFDKDEISVNPFGGIEAIITHTISNLLNVPTAHAPMLADGTFDYPYKVVDPAKAPETLSKTELFCILKGLGSAPKIITEPSLMNKEGVLTNENISCLIVPDRCIGLPVLAALEQDIPVIIVEDNQNLMKNNLDLLPWKSDKIFRAKNYLEVVGIINCLKTGIYPPNLLRPLNHTKQL